MPGFAKPRQQHPPRPNASPVASSPRVRRRPRSAPWAAFVMIRIGAPFPQRGSLAAAGCAAMATPARTSRDEPGGRAGTASFAVYALSRGRGVPEATLRAWQAIRTLLEDARREGALAQLQQTRLGLEGEVRLCAE